MFPILLAAMIWLFATGKYSRYISLINSDATNAASNSTAANSSASGTSTPGDLLSSYGMSSLQGLYSSGSENTGSQSTSTPDDLISGFTG